jgi:hypothetical protein
MDWWRENRMTAPMEVRMMGRSKCLGGPTICYAFKI